MIQSKSSKIFNLITIILLAISALVVSGCATPEEGSSMPWNRPDTVQNGSMFGIATY